MKPEPIDHWADDLLRRKDDATFLYHFLMGQAERRAAENRSYVLNLDADWGNGKTFFIDRFAKDLEAKKHIVVKINAWKDDYAADPYIVIMAAIDKAFEPYTRKTKALDRAWKATKANGTAIALHATGAVAKGVVKSFTGVDIGEIVKGITEDQELGKAIASGVSTATDQVEKLFDTSLDTLIKSFNKTSDTMEEFRRRLTETAQKYPNEKIAPIFIIIDELDRCKPIFAVKLLERIKHLFDVPNLIFVFSTNTSQLQHSISGLYGVDFDGNRYLKRFFDRTYVFEDPSIDEFIMHRLNNLQQGKFRRGTKPLNEILTLGFKAYNFDLRAIVHILEIIDTVSTAWNHPTPIEICLLLPLCANFYTKNLATWPKEVPNSWKYSKLWHDTYGGTQIDIGIDYARAYHDAIGLVEKLDDASKYFSSQEGDETNKYVREIFVPEWNGKHVKSGSKSVQADLIGLVANAGRMKFRQSS